MFSSTVEITGTIDPSMRDVRQHLRGLADAASGAPIQLVICSPGGSAIGAAAVLDEMEHIRQLAGVTFEGFVRGEASSAALTILQGCDRRHAGRFSVLMGHGISVELSGDQQRIRAQQRMIALLHGRFAELYAGRTEPRCGMTKQQWMEWFDTGQPRYWSALEALGCGLIDRIVGS